MELVFPWVLYIGLPGVIVLAFLRWKKREVFKKGKKVANTSFVEETPYYKKLIKQYKVFCTAVFGSLLIAIAICVVMLSRPAEIDIIHPDIHNRDIFMCMDISDSVDELNAEICDELRKVVKELDGERFGISIFNGQSVLLVPLTSDYDYVLQTLDKLEASFEYSLSKGTYDFDLDNFELYQYKYEGTLSDRGSSFIGDGLASCLYSFPDLKENSERSRLIIFTTDNELNGTPLVTVEEATRLCKKNGVRVFAIAPDNVVDEDNFRKSIESTGGKYYKATSSHIFDKLVDDIQKTDTSAMEDVKIVITDKPEMLFVCLLIFISIYFVFSRKVKL